MVEAGAAVCSMDPMKKERKEKVFFNKYMGILEEIEDDPFRSDFICDAMCCCYKNAKLDNNGTQLWWKYESDLTNWKPIGAAERVKSA